ncbi:hypothetical protein K3495_g7143 [Podosphaera aphanis]|nr:hypothetical protein K3495_g7143 [Podosphaera aphanis]
MSNESLYKAATTSDVHESLSPGQSSSGLQSLPSSSDLPVRTQIVQVENENLGKFQDRDTLEKWVLSGQASNTILQEAAQHLRLHDTPVAFPTETVYGLGADATRSSAVKGIYQAKGRPSDNPLIIHVCDLGMLREVITPGYSERIGQRSLPEDPIPEIYWPLIKKFWPGPLTIILPNPENSTLAPEVTAGLTTFGARMPDSPLALSLISLVGQPLAAPSANTSTKPSPTSAHHVLHDLDGKIKLIIEGGSCKFGLESTVVDGLCKPPAVLRPGGVSIESIRECPGWENVTKAYQDKSEIDCKTPRAPGMKYKHYSPKAQIILYESNSSDYTNLSEHTEHDGTLIPKAPSWLTTQSFEALNLLNSPTFPVNVGIIRTKCWAPWGGFDETESKFVDLETPRYIGKVSNIKGLQTRHNLSIRQGELWRWQNQGVNGRCPEDGMEVDKIANLVEVNLGSDTWQVAHDLFAALREMDDRSIDVIHVEGIDDEREVAGAVMNRLRKAASVIK